MLRKADKEVITERPTIHKVKTKCKEETTRIVNGYKRPVFTEIKTKKGQDNKVKIRMNSNAKQYNKGAKHTRYQVTTPQEAGHKHKEAKVNSEFAKGNGQGEGGMYKAKGAGRDDREQDVGAGLDEVV